LEKGTGLEKKAETSRRVLKSVLRNPLARKKKRGKPVPAPDGGGRRTVDETKTA